jgi:hypothetical protein
MNLKARLLTKRPNVRVHRTAYARWADYTLDGLCFINMAEALLMKQSPLPLFIENLCLSRVPKYWCNKALSTAKA